MGRRNAADAFLTRAMGKTKVLDDLLRLIEYERRASFELQWCKLLRGGGEMLLL
jgi:hypothetical protein